MFPRLSEVMYLTSESLRTARSLVLPQPASAVRCQAHGALTPIRLHILPTLAILLRCAMDHGPRSLLHGFTAQHPICDPMKERSPSRSQWRELAGVAHLFHTRQKVCTWNQNHPNQ
jgi:hypothetical protein